MAIEITHLDPWKADGDLPADAVFVGRCERFDARVEVRESLYLSGDPGGWELWSVLGTRAGRVALGTGAVRPGEAAAALFRALLRARVAHAGCRGPFEGGLLGGEELAREVADLDAGLALETLAAQEAERLNPSPILVAARELGLDPRPAGHNPAAWWANCPTGRGHSVMISSASNQFGCGYCRIKGGPEELRAARKARL